MGDIMNTYIRKCHYHETDQMGVAHHTSYIKWLEEARIFLMDEIGFSYKRMEEAGVISPIVSITCNYKMPIKFDEKAYITIHVDKYTGAKFLLSYEIRKEDGTLCLTANSSHCFLKNGQVISIRRELKEVDECFLRYIDNNND